MFRVWGLGLTCRGCWDPLPHSPFNTRISEHPLAVASGNPKSPRLTLKSRLVFKPRCAFLARPTNTALSGVGKIAGFRAAYTPTPKPRYRVLG